MTHQTPTNVSMKDNENHYDVIIVGAGAAGITAAYDLKRKHHHGNIKIKILEASNRPLGRVKKNDTFHRHPIDLGGEWISVNPSVLKDIVDDNTKSDVIDSLIKEKTFLHSAPVSFMTKQFGNVGTGMKYAEWRWNDYTWFDFFDTHIMPSIKEDIEYGSPVKSISRQKGDDGTSMMEVNVQKKEYGNDTKTVRYTTKSVIVAVPLQILKDGDITFQPPLPKSMRKNIEKVKVAGALKAWLEFEGDKFYPDFFSLGKDFVKYPGEDGSRAFWDESWGQTSSSSSGNDKDKNRHVLGLFSYRKSSERYTDMETEEEILTKIVQELDCYFDGKASQNFVKGVVQNWTKEPYIRSGYSDQGIAGYVIDKVGPLREAIRFDYDVLDSSRSSSNDKKKSASNSKKVCQVVFAGEYIAPHGSFGYIHGAAFSGREAVKQLILDDLLNCKNQEEDMPEEAGTIISTEED